MTVRAFYLAFKTTLPFRLAGVAVLAVWVGVSSSATPARAQVSERARAQTQITAVIPVRVARLEEAVRHTNGSENPRTSRIAICAGTIPVTVRRRGGNAPVRLLNLDSEHGCVEPRLAGVPGKPVELQIEPH